MVKKCPVYLHLPWFRTPSVGLKNKIKASVEKCFFAIEQLVIFTSLPLLSAIKKDVLPASLLSNVVYNFLCLLVCRPHISTNTGQNLSIHAKVY